LVKATDRVDIYSWDRKSEIALKNKKADFSNKQGEISK
jgi:hypothetical protein